jgi:hypothetical protein
MNNRGDERVNTTLHYFKSFLIDGSKVYGTVLEGKLYVLFTDIDTQHSLPELVQSKGNNLTDSFDMTLK